MESIHTDHTSNYVSFLQTYKAPKGRSDADSIHSVSSVRSVMSGMSALWSAMGVSSSSKTEKARLALENDTKYIYGAFTKLPSLRLTPDHRTPLIKGYEQFPFETAVPLFAFKNLQQLEIIDLDFRTFYGWDRLADQLCLLILKRANVEDLLDLLENIVLDDAEKRRRRSNRFTANAPATPTWSVPSTPPGEARSPSNGGSPQHASPGTSPITKSRHIEARPDATPIRARTKSYVAVESTSPKRPLPRRPATSYRHVRTYSTKAKRSGSGSSNNDDLAGKEETSPNTAANILPSSKWQRLVYLSLADNGLTALPHRSLQAITPTLRSFNLSSNLFLKVPESLARLSRLQSLDLSNCLISSLQSLAEHPLPAITTLKLKSNRLTSISGIERLHLLENLNIQDNQITDPDEVVRLTGMPNFQRLWIRHNPLTKRYSDYRIRILNHFRKTPGFVNDIILDDQPASFTERKQLVERILETNKPPSTPPAPIRTLIVQHTADSIKPTIEASDKLAVITDLGREPSDRKKGPRRRIIELPAEECPAADEVMSTKQSLLRKLSEVEPNTPTEPNVLTQNTDSAATESKHHPEGKHLTPYLPLPETRHMEDDIAKTLTNNSPIIPERDDVYRRNVEDLRLKLGNSWLSALGEQHGHWSDTNLTSISVSHQPPTLHHYHSTPPVVDVGTSIP